MMKWLWRPAIGVLALFALGGNCGGGGSSDTPCAGVNTCDQQRLTVPQVEQVISQAVAEANKLGVEATIAVLDRVGNVLAVWEMCGNPRSCSGVLPFTPADPPNETTITSNRGVTTGLDGLPVPELLAAISKAGSGAYLSSQGNAFTSRTASQIIQENFNPGESQRGGGPLFGVQFSQLPCGDFMQRFTVDAMRGPKRMPLGLAGDPGGIPLYIEGVPVGAVGVEFNGTYTVDPDIFDFDTNLEERIATAATTDFEPPDGIRAPQIAVDGRTLRYVDDEDIASNPAVAPAFSTLTSGQLLSFDGFFSNEVTAGVRFLDPASGYVRDTIGGQAAEILVDDGTPRFPPIESGNPTTGDEGLTTDEVTSILSSALEIASRARGQIRRPGGSSMRVNISIVDLDGDVLGFARSPDAPIFGGDVSLQKARTAVFFSQTNAADNLMGADMPDDAARARALGDYVNDVRDFLGDSTALANGIAFSDRAGGNLSRPFFPDGINGKPNGPLSRPFAQWSPFSTGLQLDASFNNLTRILAGNNHDTCTSPTLDTVRNGFQIFPGSVPIYRGSVLIGAIGVSGDGVDQDDMVALLAVDTAATTSGTGFNNAPLAIRADNISVGGGHLRYVSCPPTPFIGSDVQNVCAGK
jgi:uncharacterized protein GlcG (DUF336 family)